MGISMSTRQAYSEIDEFLSLLKDEEINKVPKKIRDLFKEEKDKNYKKIIDPNKPIKEQNLKEETLALIALLNLQYWCEDEQEKERLKEIYAKNEKLYEEAFQIEFNSDKIFKNKIETDNKDIEEQQVIPYKESILKKMLNRLKKLFGKK